MRSREPDLRRLGIEHLYLFGSVATGAATSDSDIDVFADVTTGAFGAGEYLQAVDVLEETLGRPVDFATRRGLHPRLLSRIEAQAIPVF